MNDDIGLPTGGGGIRGSADTRATFFGIQAVIELWMYIQLIEIKWIKMIIVLMSAKLL